MLTSKDINVKTNIISYQTVDLHGSGDHVSHSEILTLRTLEIMSR